QMPLLNGHQVTQILRKNGDQRPIIALTAHALKEELEKSLASGCDDHLTKPIDREKLIDLVAFHGGRATKARELNSFDYTHRVNMSGFHGDLRSP
nr:response regulator [Pseudobdellovibrionaceae bacterium]